MSARPYIRLAVFSLLAAAAAGPARADLPELLACADKTDNAERLACYDAAAAKLKKQVAEENQRRVTLFGFQLPFTGSDEGEKDDKGNKAPVLGPKEVNSVSAKLERAGNDGIGHIVIHLDNGQSWRVNEGTSTHLVSVPGTPIQIVRNIFGGFYMNIEGGAQNVLVTRMQ
jgi:hypothetical protein